jgi:hypothetical protein
MRSKSLLAGLLAAALAPAAHAQWSGNLTGTGAGSQLNNYLTTSNWGNGTINDTFSAAQTGNLNVYFNGPRTTSGAAGVSFSGFGPFGESLTLGQNGLVDAHASANTLTIQGGGTFGSVPAAAQTLTLGGDLVNNNGSSAFNSLVLGGAGNNALNINLGNATRTFYSAASRPIIVTNDVTNGSVVKQGTGNLVFQGNNSITNLVVGRNNVAVSTTSLQAGGRLSNTTDILVLPNASFRIDNQSSTPISRLNSSGSMTLSSGLFANQFAAGTGSARAYSDAIGQFIISAGNNIFEQGVASNAVNDNTITFNLGALTRQNNSLLTIRNVVGAATPASGVAALGTTGNTAFISNIAALTSAGLYVGGNGSSGTTTQSVFTFAVGQSGVLSAATAYDTLATYDSTFGLRGLNLTTEFASSFGGNANDNVRLTAVTNVTSNQTANALVLAANNNLNINSGQTLTITSGAINNFGAATIAGPGTLAFGAAEGVINAPSAGGGTISANVTGSGGLTLGVGFAATTLSGDNSGLTGRVSVLGRGLASTSNLNVNNNNALGTANPLTLGSGVIATIGATGNVTARVASLEGGSFNQSGRVALQSNSGDGFVIGTGASTLGTLILDGSSSTTYIDPGYASGPNEVQIGILELNGGAAIARNGDIRIDLFSAPLTNGSLAQGYNDLLLLGTSFDLANGGDLKLSINSLYGSPAFGTTWTIAVAGGAAGVNTITNSNGGSLFDSVTSGYQVSIGNYGTGTNNALLLTVVPEPSTWMLFAGAAVGYGLLIRRRRS